jgi:polyhydroxyalkanoate synthesis regulator phasin
MTKLDDVRKTFEAALGNLTPARAQELAKGLEPNAAKEQIAKTAADMIEWSQRNRERLSDFIRKEIKTQVSQMGLATQDEVDALKKRVRELERAAGMTASGRKKTTARKAAARKTTAKKATTSKPSGSAGSVSAPPASTG